jgi:hypothetical protein
LGTGVDPQWGQVLAWGRRCGACRGRGADEKGGATNGISKVACSSRGGGEDSSSNEVAEMGLGRKHSMVRGAGGGAKGSRSMNNEKRRICLLNDAVAATG